MFRDVSFPCVNTRVFWERKRRKNRIFFSFFPLFCPFLPPKSVVSPLQDRDMAEDGSNKTKLVPSYSVPKEIVEEADLHAQTQIQLTPQSHLSKSGSVGTSTSNADINSNTHYSHDRKQNKFDFIQEKLAKIDGTVAHKPEGAGTSKKIDYHKRDRTPTRNELQLHQQLEDGDKTPPRSQKNKIRLERGRKRRRNNESDNENSQSDSDVIKPDTKKSSVAKTLGNNSEINSKVPVVLGIYLTEDNLNKLLPSGFNIVPFPDNYKPLNNSLPDFTKLDSILTSSNALLTTTNDNSALKEDKLDTQLIYQIPDLKDLQFFSESDLKVFRKLITSRNDKNLSNHDQLELRCMKLILKIKNCSQASRKSALRNLTDNAKNYGPDIIFSIILPLLSESTLDDRSRHLLIKVVGRVMLKLEDDIKPYAEKILVVMMPLLADENKFTRLEGRDVISKLTKIVGLLTLINILRPDLSSDDEYVRTLVSKTFAVIANTLGIPILLPFLKAVCHSKDNWNIRFTGTKIIQQIAILMGSLILPNLNQLILCINKNIEDEVLNVRIITASTISSLAEAASPYGFESFQILIKPLWKGLKNQRGKCLAQFIRALGNLIPLMDIQNSNFYSSDLLKIIKRELNTADDDMKRAILITIIKICNLDFIKKSIIYQSQITKSFFTYFWVRKMATEKKFSNLCINACFSLSLKVGVSEVILEILPSLKDESESFRKMGLETSDKVITSLGSFDLNDKSVNRLLDGALYVFQNQNLENKQMNQIILNSFGNILNNLGIRVKPHIMTIVSAILYRLKNKNSDIREQAADLIVKIVPVLKICDETDLLIRLCTILYESLGEVYPNVLGSILNALRSVILSIESVDSLNPSIQQISSTLTPILRNKHEKVQEMTINLIGDIAERAKDYINHKEWMRISFELLEMLKAYKKSIRKSANKTFGLIAKAIGPADVLVTLLNNLRVQERQLRVCTAVAIGIVSEVCLPFSVLPALMNEYRYPDKNVQNGVLKAIGFMFEYIGELGSDYIYATTPLLLDALTDRDLVHRQIASNVVKHMSLGAFGRGYEDAFINFLDLIWPNIFETSPHVISQVLESIESLSVVLGCGVILDYIWSGLFHPARKVRESYWKIYNSIYINNVHAMVPYYPRFEEIGREPTEQEVLNGKYDDSDTKELRIVELDLWV